MRYYKPDVEKAKKLMAEAGQAAGFTVKCVVIPTFPTMVSGAPVIAAHLKRIGITVEIENVEYAIWIKRWLAKDFDMTMNTTPGYADPDTAFFRALHSTKGQNWNSWSVPDLDALLEEGRRTHGPGEAEGDLRPRADQDPGERAAPLALLRRHHRLHPDLA